MLGEYEQSMVQTRLRTQQQKNEMRQTRTHALQDGGSNTILQSPQLQPDSWTTNSCATAPVAPTDHAIRPPRKMAEPRRPRWVRLWSYAYPSKVTGRDGFEANWFQGRPTATCPPQWQPSTTASAATTAGLRLARRPGMAPESRTYKCLSR